MTTDFFPYKKVREEQKEMLEKVADSVQEGTHLIVHAPTGLGKTAATLAPALSSAKKDGKIVFFLTSRHTQHRIAINTAAEISKKHDVNLNVVDIIAKKHMCLAPEAKVMFSSDFIEFCKNQRENKKCKFFNNLREKGRLSKNAQKAMDHLKKNILHTENLIAECKKKKLCPYEMCLELGKSADLVVADYNYIFNPNIRDNFLAKIGMALSDCVIIVDEAHNLASRLRELMTERLSNTMIKRAIKEAKKFGYDEMIETLAKIQDVINELSYDIQKEKLVTEKDFTKKIEAIDDYEKLLADLEFTGDAIRETQRQSYIGSIAKFLDSWRDDREEFVRIISVRETATDLLVVLSKRCLDPSIVTKEVIEHAYSILCMSGTLTPTEMYRDILGFEKAEIKEYKSPFPKKNRLNIIVPKTTTKYSQRNAQQYRNIAKICSEITNNVPGNSLLFFPSYALRNDILTYSSFKKDVFTEKYGATKDEREELLEKFKQSKEKGAVLLATASGSFGEGIDLPGDFLKAVIVIGLPLNPPDLETKALIDYYDKKFAKGWDYGYVLPAITKCMQNAGRCIRSEKDKGITVFVDERFALNHYFKCFPQDWEIEVTTDYVDLVEKFFM